jgi:hypothetical protein
MAGASWSKSLSAFNKWLAAHPLEGDRPYGSLSVRYHVARYCDYLEANPSGRGGNPLQHPAARDSALVAYKAYLSTFNADDATIRLILASLDHFYRFLGLGAVKVSARD